MCKNAIVCKNAIIAGIVYRPEGVHKAGDSCCDESEVVSAAAVSVASQHYGTIVESK